MPMREKLDLRSVTLKGGFALVTVIIIAVLCVLAGYIVRAGCAPAGPASDTIAAQQAGKETIWTCSMHPEIRSDKPGRCPKCGMELIPLEIESSEDKQKEQPGATIWTCSMHPEIRSDKPGRCPKCGMELVPVAEEPPGRSQEIAEFKTTEQAKALMEIEVAPVERKFVETQIRMVGAIEYDETKQAYITAWVPGRLDRLFVDYTGIPVRKGDHMVNIYSPELFSAQQELIQAIAAAGNVDASSSAMLRRATESIVTAAREKLRLLGLTAEQIKQIEASGTAAENITIYSPVSGIVVHKNAQEGMYVQTGTRIYTIADLSQLWVMLDAYESDLTWIRYGQDVQFTTVSYPGEVFTGTIAFIDPVVNTRTRTVKVRVNASNADGKLKPGMFVKAVVNSKIAAGGRVAEPALAGKWICPMHPDIIKDSAGECDICRMPLVTAESLGYVTADEATAEKPIVVPAPAVLVTGQRAVVYVQVPNAETPTYRGREITLGPLAGDYYIVKEGLAEGELVVTRGNFKIDSALQIQARPSMMSGGDMSMPAQSGGVSNDPAH